MSKIQDLRDKIHRLNGKQFKLADLKSTNKMDYRYLKEMTSNHELIQVTRDTGINDIYISTSSLKIRQAAKDAIPEITLKGWREVMPYYFEAPSNGVLYSIY